LQVGIMQDTSTVLPLQLAALNRLELSYFTRVIQAHGSNKTAAEQG